MNLRTLNSQKYCLHHGTVLGKHDSGINIFVKFFFLTLHIIIFLKITQSNLLEKFFQNMNTYVWAFY